MPIKRKLVKDFNTLDRIISMAIETVRLIQQPLSDQGWKHLIASELEIDIDTSANVFEELVTRGILLFTRTQNKRTIYITDRTPEFKKYMWFGDLQYE